MTEGERPPGSRIPVPGISAQKNVEDKPKRWDKAPVAIALAANLHRAGATLIEIASVLRNRGFVSINGGELRSDVFIRYLNKNLSGPLTTPDQIQKFLDQGVGRLSTEDAQSVERAVTAYKDDRDHAAEGKENKSKGGWSKDPLAVALIIELRKADISWGGIERILDEMKYTTLTGSKLQNGSLETYVTANSTRSTKYKQTEDAFLQSLANSLPPADPAEVLRIVEEQKAQGMRKKGAGGRRTKGSRGGRESETGAEDARTREIDTRIRAYVEGKTGSGPWTESADARLVLAAMLGNEVILDYDIGAMALTALGYVEEGGKEITGKSIEARLMKNAPPAAFRERRSPREIIEKNVGAMPSEEPSGFVGFAAVLKNYLQTRAAILRRPG